LNLNWNTIKGEQRIADENTELKDAVKKLEKKVKTYDEMFMQLKSDFSQLKEFVMSKLNTTPSTNPSSAARGNLYTNHSVISEEPSYLSKTDSN